jgi:hypothetical protein
MSVGIKIGRGELSPLLFNNTLDELLSLPVSFKLALLPSKTIEEIDVILTELYNKINHDRSEGVVRETKVIKPKSTKPAIRNRK